LVLAHDSGLAALEQAGMGYFEVNAIACQREAMATMGVLERRPDLLALSHKLMAVLGTVCVAALAGQGGGGGVGGGAV